MRPAPRVLLIEDHDFQRRALSRVLASLGVAPVLEAADGAQALALIGGAAPPVELVICDLDMPNMDGMEFMRHLGRVAPRASLIIHSAQSEALLYSVGEMARAQRLRLLGAVGKPANAARLRELFALHAAQGAAAHAPAPPRPVFALEEILQGVSAGQFEAFFQPKIELATGRLVGAEALARWRHPRHGVVAPGAFVPVLESAGRIDELTLPILERSLAACGAWRAAGRALHVSVNLSLGVLGDTGLAERITRAAREAGVQPSALMLEVTESAALSDVGAALENLARLRMRGFGLSIDDFGTGFSSMQQLARVPFSELKIDRGFVQEAVRRRDARVIVESSLAMARELGLRTVAEGVETPEQRALLARMGCDEAQGYLFAPPLEAAAFAEFRHG